jgi:hypothetical protein
MQCVSSKQAGATGSKVQYTRTPMHRPKRARPQYAAASGTRGPRMIAITTSETARKIAAQYTIGFLWVWFPGLLKGRSFHVRKPRQWVYPRVGSFDPDARLQDVPIESRAITGQCDGSSDRRPRGARTGAAGTGGVAESSSPRSKFADFLRDASRRSGAETTACALVTVHRTSRPLRN